MTRNGADPLLPKSENVAIIIEPPTDEEVNAAITGNMGHLVTVVRSPTGGLLHLRINNG